MAYGGGQLTTANAVNAPSQAHAESETRSQTVTAAIGAAHRRGGRQAVVTPEKLAKARQHLAAGLNVREAAARVKIGKTALYEALKAEK